MTVVNTTTPIGGLSDQEVEAQRARGLVNTPPPPTTRTYQQILKENIFTFINNILFLLAIALVLVGRPVDALISLSVISTNIVVSVVQEIRAKRTLDRVALLTRPRATVVRSGQERELPPEELVLGDVLRVGPGDQILVDGKVIAGRMNVDESQLTGESNLIPKEAESPVFSGSFCVSGGAHFVAEKVGSESFANQLTAQARTFRRVLTPLQRQINLTIRVILLIVLYMETLLFANGLVKAISLPEGIQQATVIAGLVPNGLFVAIAVAYALAAVRILRFGALVQQSNAIESLSNVDVLCLDKTGTLTTNQLQLQATYPLACDDAALREALAAMMASTGAPNKTSAAIATALPASPRPLVTEVPFSSARKWSAVAFDDDGLRGIYALGAPEMLQPYLGPDAALWDTISSQAATWTAAGLRVLLAVHDPDPSRLQDHGDESRLPTAMKPMGLVSLSDELRPEARETLASFIHNGVKPKIISGDNPETVAALARQAGLGPDIRLVSGLELATMEPAQLEIAAVEATIFGRITPQQKEQLVDSLRARGHYVAMIGDGVNDVLSLKKANLGVAMQSGTQATRGVADIVLMNDSFAALAPAVAEGQRIVNGMQDILKLYLARIATMALVILSALVIGMFPINLRHASVINLLTVGIPSVILAVWSRPGYRYRHSLVGRLMHFVLPAAILSSLLGLVVFYLPYLYQMARLDPTLPAGQTQVLAARYLLTGQTSLAAFLVITGLLLVVFAEPPTSWWVGGDSLSGDWRPTFLAAGLFVVFVALMAVPSLRGIFDLEPLPLVSVGLIAVATLVWLFLIRLVWQRRWLERFFDVGV